MDSKEHLYKLVETLTKFSLDTVRAREIKPLGYGKFEIHETLMWVARGKDSNMSFSCNALLTKGLSEGQLING